MKSRILTIILFLFLGLSLFGFDWGGDIQNSTDLIYVKGFSLNQLNRLNFWIGHDSEDFLDFLIKGNYTYTPDIPYLFDLEVLEVKGVYPLDGSSLFSFKAGRFKGGEFSGKVFSHTLDGVELTWSSPAVEISLLNGYTGLILRPDTAIVMSLADDIDRRNETLLLSSYRLVDLLELTFPEVIGRQTLNLSLLAQWDLRLENVEKGEVTYNSSLGGKLNTQYLLLGLNGPLADLAEYEVYGVLNTGQSLYYDGTVYTDAFITGWMGGGIIRFYTGGRSSSLDVEGSFSSGDKDNSAYWQGYTEKFSTQFVPVSLSSRGMLYSPKPGNLIATRVAYTMKPESRWTLVISEQTYFRSTTGPVSEEGVDEAVQDYYLGSEVDFKAGFVPFSDLGMAFSGGVFFPGTAFESGSSISAMMKVELQLSF